MREENHGTLWGDTSQSTREAMNILKEQKIPFTLVLDYSNVAACPSFDPGRKYGGVQPKGMQG